LWISYSENRGDWKTSTSIAKAELNKKNLNFKMSNMNMNIKIEYSNDNKKFPYSYWVDGTKMNSYMLPSFTKKIVQYLEKN